MFNLSMKLLCIVVGISTSAVYFWVLRVNDFTFKIKLQGSVACAIALTTILLLLQHVLSGILRRIVHHIRTRRGVSRFKKAQDQIGTMTMRKP